MTETKVKRTTDARIARLREAKAAALKWFNALKAHHAAGRRARLAAAQFTRIINTAETPEEEAFLATLAKWTPEEVGVEDE